MTEERDCIEGVSLIRGDLRLDWDELGEGISGDYDPDNPADVELLRFTLYHIEDNEWAEIDDASYCTNVSVATDTVGRQRLLVGLMDEFFPAAGSGNSVKKLAERLSWIDEEWYQPCEHPDRKS